MSRVWRPDVEAKARGSFTFATDVTVDGALKGATVRSPLPHARVVRVDTAPARSVPGVVRVLTAADVPGARCVGHIVSDQPVFATDVVRYHGEPVAFVVATTAEAAREGARRVVVELEPLPVLVDAELALASDAPVLHPDGNLYRRLEIRQGDPDVVAPVTVGATWHTGRQDQLFLAPESGLAEPTADGGVRLRVATQDLHADRAQIASALGLPEDRVVVELAGIGGAFGGREDITLQIHLCLAAHLLRAPVTATYTRAESFLAHPKRHPARLRYELGADLDGRLLVLRADILLDGGAYASTSAPVLGGACWFSAGPYRIPNVTVVGRSVATNQPISGAMRGFGAVQACFGIESTMDLLAAKLGIDPVELRRINALRPGDRFPTSGQPVGDDGDVLELIDRCNALPQPCSRVGRDHVRATGFALGVKNHLYGEGYAEHATAVLRASATGIEVASAATECGQGLGGVLARIASEEFGGLPVSLAPATSDLAYAGSSSASRATWMSGGAVRLAAVALREQLAELGVQPRCCASLAEVLGDRTIEVTRTYHAPRTEPGRTGASADVHVSWMFVAHRATVDVDPELGTVRVVQVATAQGVGRAIAPDEIVGQIRGGISQGLGLALDEHLATDGAVVINNGLTDYLIPTAADMPDIVVDLVERPDPRSPHGGKGVGEPPSLSSTAAIASAVRAATGRPIRRVPMRPEDVAGSAELG